MHALCVIIIWLDVDCKIEFFGVRKFGNSSYYTQDRHIFKENEIEECL